MKNKKAKNNNWKFPKKVFICFLLIMLVFSVQLGYLALSKDIYGINMKDFSANRNTVKTILKSQRGTIYDKDGNTLASNVTSYTVIAYLNEKITGTSKIQKHVTDVHKTAESLSPIINMDVAAIEKLLNDGIANNSWQVELGPGGRNITELKKEQIESLGLPGIDFVESTKRYYPNGDFASYIIGYVRRYEEPVFENGIEKIQYNLVGEMGIEAKYNENLTGKDGSITYQKDLSGYKIPDTPETLIPAQNGNDIYLTIDSNVQRFVEAAVKDVVEEANPEWTTITVMDAKTGEILGTSASPSFDPNIKDITNYENPLITKTYEPGSTMKIYTYMCAMETGNYDGNATYESGSIKFSETEEVKDWNKYGWGSISYDKGFEYSSNVAVSTLLQTILNKNKYRECLEKYGFGQKTGIELSNESNGNISTFNYPIETANASFGQGITITAMQMLQGLTIISNNGKMLKPHLVSKIVDSNKNEVIYSAKKEETERIVSEETVEKIKKLMYNVVNSPDENATGRFYNINGLNVIGKTGTAQIYDVSQNKYLDGENDYIFSFAGMYPYEDPEIIIYTTMKKPVRDTSWPMVRAARLVMESVAKYKGIYDDTSNVEKVPTYTLENYINKNINDVKQSFEGKNIEIITIGNGNTIVNQYPKVNSTITEKEKLFLVTDNNDITMPNLTNWSLGNAKKFFELANISYMTEGYGYVKEQSIPEGTLLDKSVEVKIVLYDKYYYSPPEPVENQTTENPPPENTE